jgi:hypothetical protein
MSLDVTLTKPNANREVEPARILVRENGSIRELSRTEWDERFPGLEPVMLTSDDEGDVVELFSANITHNLGKMAEAAGIYYHLWRPEEIGITKAGELIAPLRSGLELMRSNPAQFEAHNAPNGWGTYKHFIPWIQNYLDACETWPDADVHADR